RLAEVLSEIAVCGIESGSLRLRWLLALERWRSRPVVQLRRINGLQTDRDPPMRVDGWLAHLSPDGSAFEGMGYSGGCARMGREAKCIRTGQAHLYRVRIRFANRPELCQIDRARDLQQPCCHFSSPTAFARLRVQTFHARFATVVLSIHAG